MIVDQVHLLVQAGNGGNGCESYLTRPDKKRVPHGGNGGKGGSIVLRASTNAQPIGNLKFKQHVIAQSGEHGKSNRKQGRNGEDLIILVPCGAKIYDREKDLLIRELLKEDEEVVVVQGGAGGSGNYGGKTASFGEAGQRLEVEITVRIQADVFFVGLPNSGKSTLLNRLTRAHVKQGDYPFATRHPEIGVWSATEYEQWTLCELPSIYRSSHEGRGVGIDFLKHLEAATLIAIVLDPVSQFAHNLEEGYQILTEQIRRYREMFSNIPTIVIINKTDLPEVQEKIEKEKWSVSSPTFSISALTGEGVEAFTTYLKEHVTSRTL